jgi:hypothetical protein
VTNLTEPIWSKRSEVVHRLLAQECELCGSHQNVEMQHIRKLKDLKQKGRTKQKPCCLSNMPSGYSALLIKDILPSLQ